MTTALFPSGSAARFSQCGRYRYTLSRRWGDGELCAFVMLNPSTATAELDDPTIRRCINFAKSWGFAGLEVRNIFALRATNPRELYKVADPIGPDNNAAIIELADLPLIVAAWGVHGIYHGRGDDVRRLLLPKANWKCLRKTAQGHPGHPLYVPAWTELERF